MDCITARLFAVPMFIAAGWSLVLLDNSDNVIGIADNTALLSCKFSDGLNITVEWQKSGAAMLLDTRVYMSIINQNGTQVLTTLLISQLGPADGGLYRCKAKDATGSEAYADISVTVTTIPAEITSHFENPLYVAVGQRHEVLCTADGRPKASLSWSRYQGLLDSSFVSSFSNGSLIFKVVRESDAGEYACEARSDKSVATASFNVTVVKYTTWVLKPSSQTKQGGNSFEWKASFVTDAIAPKVQWFRNLDQLPSSGFTVLRSGAKFDSSLKFEKLTVADAGGYRLTVGSDAVSDVLVADLSLTVNAKPNAVIMEGLEVTALVGSDVSFYCEVQGYPPPSVSWVFNGSVLVERAGDLTKALRGSVIGLKVQLAKVTKTQEGEYHCRGFNDFGYHMAKINLLVEDKAIGAVKSSTTTYIVIAVGLIVIVAIVIVVVFFVWRHRKNRHEPKVKFYGGGRFYTDLGEEERDFSTLEEIEESAHIPKTLSVSIKRQDRPNSKKAFTSTAPRGSRKQSVKASIMSPDGGHARGSTLFGSQGKPIEFSKINFDELIGEGEFGDVAKGRISEEDGNFKDVSIKMLKEESGSKERCDILSELQMMRKISRHPNVIALIGWCVLDDNVYVLEEYAPLGSLLDTLRAHRSYRESCEVLTEASSISSAQLLAYAWQVSCGMKYLASCQIIHRDLACRNVLLGREHICKVTDYGISREVYTENVFRKVTGGQLPVRWLAYESLFRDEFSSQSDVWSFGVLLWEVVTLGRIPYPGIIRTEELLVELESGYTMPKPDHISQALFDVMRACWNREPEGRPVFAVLSQTLGDLQYDETEHINLARLYQLELDDANASENAILLQSPVQKGIKKSPFAARLELAADVATSEPVGEFNDADVRPAVVADESALVPDKSDDRN